MELVFGCGEGCGPPKKKAAEKVSETAKELFYRRGIRAVGVDEIVSEAGVTKPSLYRSFASKDELITSCLREHMEESRARWDQALAKAPGDPRAQLSHVLREFAELMTDEGFRGCPISNAAVEFPEPGHPAHILAHEMKMEARERFLCLIRQLDAADPDELADALVLLIEGASATRHFFCDKGPASALVPAAEALIDSYTR